MTKETLCKGGQHRGPFTFAKVAGWMVCSCGNEIMTENIEANRSRLVPTPKEEFAGITPGILRGTAPIDELVKQ